MAKAAMFGNGDAVSSAAGGIRYDPTLIGSLQDDHRVLLALYGDIGAAAQARRWHQASALLAEFRKQLTAHLLTEAVKLYVYLRRRLADDPERLRQMRAFSSEMVKIGRVVVTFVEEHARLHQAPEKQVAFLARWQEIGAVLSDRIGREERILYPMYEGEDRPLTDTALPPAG